MVKGNLRGYEALAGLSPEAADAAEGPAPSSAAGAETGEAEAAVPTPEQSAQRPPETPPAESAPALSEQQARIDSFLTAQAAFAEYALPANVSLDAPVLPFDYVMPCAGGITSGFGFRRHPLDGDVKYHYGTDLGAYDGDPVYAFADGHVLTVSELDGYGLNVLIAHPDGLSTHYAHCSQILVEEGMSVKKGDRIALAGHTGKVTGPHLHFEMIYNGKYLNPEFYL
jgi:murein DD-endopeptidase MepM/ murein hydrolase activator NlpD